MSIKIEIDGFYPINPKTSLLTLSNRWKGMIIDDLIRNLKESGIKLFVQGAFDISDSEIQKWEINSLPFPASEVRQLGIKIEEDTDGYYDIESWDYKTAKPFNEPIEVEIHNDQEINLAPNNILVQAPKDFGFANSLGGKTLVSETIILSWDKVFINGEDLKAFEQKHYGIDHEIDLSKLESKPELTPTQPKNETSSETAIKTIGLLMELLAESPTYKKHGGDPSLSSIKGKLLDKASDLKIDSYGLKKADDKSNNGILTLARDYINKNKTDS